MTTPFDSKPDSENDSDVEERIQYPHTYRLVQAIERLNQDVTFLYYDLMGDGVTPGYEGVSGLCNEVEVLHQKVTDLKEELGILQEWSVWQHRDEVRRAFEQFQSALIQAPPVEPDLFWHADACSRFCQEYKSWYRGARERALDLRLAPFTTEVARAQRLAQYRVKLADSASGDGEDDIIWANERKPVETKYLSRIPYVPPLSLPPDEFSQHDSSASGGEDERCTWCGVRAGELHLVDSECRPLCYGEKCPQCRKSAISCGHCEYAQEDPTATVMRAEVTGGELARDNVRPEDVLTCDDLPF